MPVPDLNAIPDSQFFLAEAAGALNVTGILIGTLGGLAMFLYGMHKMSDGLKAVAGDSMKTLLAKLTTNRFSAAITGAFAPASERPESLPAGNCDSVRSGGARQSEFGDLRCRRSRCALPHPGPGGFSERRSCLGRS